LFCLFTFAINMWHRKFVTADVTAVFVNNQHGIKHRGQGFDKKFVFEGVHSKEVDRRISWKKNWTRRGVNKLFKKLRDTGTVDRRPGSGRPRSARIEENGKLLHQKFPQSATDVVLPIVRWSHREHLFVRKENKVSGILRELLKQKLSALHACSTVHVCQLLCTVPLETFQMQVLTNNSGNRRPMNTRLPWYLTDSLASLRLVLSFRTKLECGPMPNLMVALSNTGGALCSTPQSWANAHY